MIPIPFGYMTSGVGLPAPNTFIGGVSSVITNETQLASYLSLTAANISNFVISGSDISCYISTGYSINSHAFNNDGTANDWGNGAVFTYYFDFDGKCTTINTGAFINQLNIIYVLFNSVLTVGASCFWNCTSLLVARFGTCTTINGQNAFRECDALKYIYIQACTTLGLGVGNDFVFSGAFSSIKVIANTALSTVNGGGPDGDLAYVTGTLGGTVTYVANTTAPSSISDLAVDAVYGTALDISWTAPASTNTIDHYEIFANEVFIGYTSSLSYTLAGLLLNTEYSIKVLTVDIYGNTSESNVVTQTTAATYQVPTGNIVSYWNFDTDSLDQVGTNHGTDTSMSYVASGGIGNVADFTASTSANIDVADAANLSFGNGTTDSPFSILLRFKLTSKNDLQLIGKRTSSNTQKEYHIWMSTSDILNFRLFDESASAQLNINYTLTPLLSTWYEITATYDGSGAVSGMKLYVNAVNVGTESTTGTYTAMENGTGTVMLGKWQQDTISSLNGYMDETAIFNKELTVAEVSDIYAKHQAGQYLTQ